MKEKIKKMIGQENWTKLSGHFKQAKCAVYYLKSGNKKVELDTGWSMETYSVPNRHTFFGYYDIEQLDKNEKKLLAHCVPLKANSSEDKAQIGYFNVGSEEFHEVTQTSAWCWQQGARLRWYPLDESCIVFNNVYDHKFVSEVWNVENKLRQKRISRALYDFDKSFTYGISLNFARLQRLRPGYGYNALKDDTIGNNAPKEDGIFYVDLNNDTSELIVSLYDLAVPVDQELKYEHYVNHISISPDGKKMIFFHIWNVSEGTGWCTRLYIYNFSDGKLKLLEDIDKVSHYDWRGNEEILVTCYRQDKSQYYAMYNISTGGKYIIGAEILCKDGHPSFLLNNDQFITDTYPLAHCKQHLFVFDVSENTVHEIISLYSSPSMSGEKRCDLHPRLSKSENMILLDSTYSQNRRKIVLLQRRKKSESWQKQRKRFG